MKVGTWKRVGSTIIDIMPIIGLLSILFTLFVGDLLKPDEYEASIVEHNEITEYYQGFFDQFQEQFDNGEISQETYDAEVANLMLFYNQATVDLNLVAMNYFGNTILYFFISFNGLYYAYNLFTKGRTLGRRMLKIELKGKINWWTLFIREIIWKTGFWSVTLGGGILLDMAMIGLSARKQSLRDMVTQTRIAYEGVDYPF